MFELIKQNVSLLDVLKKDLGVDFKQTGERNWIIDGDKDLESCPFCNHHDCFKVSHVEDEKEKSFYKCFSCDEKGDVVTWRSKHKSINMGDAARELAQEYGIQLPKSGTNPVQQVFNLAAAHYHACLIEVAKGSAALAGKTPLDYQLGVRRRTKEVLERFKVGYSTGELTDYLSALGVDPEVAELSGLVRDGRDFLPKGCFIYPHFVNGRVSHFTFKDPLKKLAYQLPKKFSLNGYKFYNQDSVKDASVVVIVEGENDLLAVEETGKSRATIATIGQIGADQITWLKENCAGKKIITIFDPDNAGDKYRRKLEGHRRLFKGLRHIVCPNDQDIDEALINGADLEDLVKNYAVEVKPDDGKDEPEVSPLDWDPPKEPAKALDRPVEPPFDLSDTQPSVSLPEGYGTILEANPTVIANPVTSTYTPPVELNSPTVIPAQSVYVPPEEPDEEVLLDGCAVYQSCGRYWRQGMDSDGNAKSVMISDFTIQLLNVYVKEDGDRQREVQIRKSNGRRSAPFLIDSKTKVTMKDFKVLVAKILDCSWTGREQDLDAMWSLVYHNFNDREIQVPVHVGRHAASNGWLFRNVYISEAGKPVSPDDNEVFWSPDGKSGIKPQSIMSDGDIGAAIPALDTGKTREEADHLLEGVIRNLSANLGSTGKALLSLGWMYSNVYSDMIFKHNRGMSMFMYWGKHGGGKSTVMTWLRSLFGLYENVGKTSVVLLKSGVGFLRMAAYYSSLPMFLDELRSDEQSKSYTDMIRSWYDREGRPLASKDDPNSIRMQKIRSTLMIAGEDIPEDPATKERIVAIRMFRDDDKRRDMVNSYAWFQEQGTALSCIGYYWILDSYQENEKELLEAIGKMDLQLRAAGCSSRISKKLSAAGYFGQKLAERYCPGFEFIDYLVQESREEQAQQSNESTLNTFWEMVEAMMARGDNSRINSEHIRVEKDQVHIWFSAVFQEVSEANRGRVNWSRNAILRLIREEPYYVSDSKKVTMGMNGTRRQVITLDLNKCNDILKNIAGENA